MSIRDLCKRSSALRSATNFSLAPGSSPARCGLLGGMVMRVQPQSWSRCSPAARATGSRLPSGGKAQVAYGVYAQGGFCSRLKSSANSPGLSKPLEGNEVYKNRHAPYVVVALVVSRKIKNRFVAFG